MVNSKKKKKKLHKAEPIIADVYINRIYLVKKIGLRIFQD